MSKFSDMAYRVFGFTEDMIGALGERPRIFLWIIRLLMGKYAWHELVGAKRIIDLDYGTDRGLMGYGLEGMDYHKTKEFNK